jgi:iron complex transport system ATP-binding protein
MSALLEARDLHCRLGSRTVLGGISLRIQPGDNIALLGANGAGKSTLLRILLGLLRPHAGEVLLAGKPQSSLKRRSIARLMAYVPQSHTPSFPFSVRQIVVQGRLPLNGLGQAPSRDDHVATERALTEMGIEALAERTYTELSGGERQLVLIARALVQQARLIVLDEPVTGLDYGHQLRLLQHLEKLANQGLAILASTHRPEHALASANRAWVLDQGLLIADGPPRGVINTDLIQRLYQIKVRQIDSPPHRFFVPLEP